MKKMIVKKKTCECAIEHWDFQYIKYFTLILLIVNVMNVFFSILFNIFTKKIRYFLMSIGAILLVFNIIYIVAIFKYLNRTKDCKCSKSWEEKLLRGYSIYLIILYSIVFMTLFIFIYSISRAKLKKS